MPGPSAPDVAQLFQACLRLVDARELTRQARTQFSTRCAHIKRVRGLNRRSHDVA